MELSSLQLIVAVMVVLAVSFALATFIALGATVWAGWKPPKPTDNFGQCVGGCPVRITAFRGFIQKPATNILGLVNVDFVNGVGQLLNALGSVDIGTYDPSTRLLVFSGDSAITFLFDPEIDALVQQDVVGAEDAVVLEATNFYELSGDPTVLLDTSDAETQGQKAWYSERMESNGVCTRVAPEDRPDGELIMASTDPDIPFIVSLNPKTAVFTAFVAQGGGGGPACVKGKMDTSGGVWFGSSVDQLTTPVGVGVQYCPATGMARMDLVSALSGGGVGSVLGFSAQILSGVENVAQSAAYERATNA